MASIYTNVLSNEEIHYLNNHPEVLAAKTSIDSQSSGKVYFQVPITNLIRSTLESKFGLHLSVDSQIPMRWIKGDTAPHVDRGLSKFKNTYLVYLNDSPGELIIDSQSYPIQSNNGFVFNEGLPHETQYTENVPRLLLGPMNELIEPVGEPLIYYFNNQEDAEEAVPSLAIGNSGNYTVDTIDGITGWRIASSSSGSSLQSAVYTTGDTLINDGVYFLYPSAPCFLEGSTILCQVDGVEKYVPVEQLNNGTLVKTSLDGYKPVVLIGKGTIHNPGDDERTENRIYKCSTSKYTQLKDDLYITGCHAILDFSITEKQKDNIIKRLIDLPKTDNQYRLWACMDERAEPWNSKGEYTIWHFALENNDDKAHYGVYANGGLLVETCSIHYLREKSSMKLIE